MSRIKKFAEQELGEEWEQMLDEINREAQELEEDERHYRLANRSPRYSEGPSETHNELRHLQREAIRQTWGDE